MQTWTVRVRWEICPKLWVTGLVGIRGRHGAPSPSAPVISRAMPRLVRRLVSTTGYEERDPLAYLTSHATRSAIVVDGYTFTLSSEDLELESNDAPSGSGGSSDTGALSS